MNKSEVKTVSKSLPKTDDGAEWVDTAEPKPVSPLKWSGVCRSMECARDQGFPNFRLVTLTIDNGIVVKKEVSQPYANFEAVARLEIDVQKAALALQFNYHEGKTWDQ